MLLLLLIALPFALAGTARILLFSVNHLVFGRKDEHTLANAAFVIAGLLLAILSGTLWPMYRSVTTAHFTRTGAFGAAWYFVTAMIGLYWIPHRIFNNLRRKKIEGTELLSQEVVRIRRSRLPFAWLKKIGAHNEIYDLEINLHRVHVENLPAEFEGYRIGFLSDTHVSSRRRRALYSECMKQLRSHEVQLVLFGGDFVSFRRHIPVMAELLTTELAPPDGSFAVLGNHDYWADRDGIVAALTARGVRFLENQSVRINRNGAHIHLVGLDELYRGHIDVCRAIANCRDDAPRIVLAHHPDTIDLLDGVRSDLLLCGHTHGGQIRLPLMGAIVVPSAHETRYDHGFFRTEDTLMYVGRGIGAVPPIRILCRPELPIFELTRS